MARPLPPTPGHSLGVFHARQSRQGWSGLEPGACTAMEAHEPSWRTAKGAKGGKGGKGGALTLLWHRAGLRLRE